MGVPPRWSGPLRREAYEALTSALVAFPDLNNVLYDVQTIVRLYNVQMTMSMSGADRPTHRAKLLEAARVLLGERDYGTITARELVAASNTNLGSIGYHFGSKEALLNEAIGLAFEEWCDAIIRSTRADTRAGPLALLDSLRLLLDDYDSMRPYYQAFIAALARSARSPELRMQLAGHYNRQRDRVAAGITDSTDGAIGSDDARHLASIIIGAADGLLIQSFIDPEHTPSSTEVASSCASALEVARSRASGTPRS
jgi:AcrR family transcriptional regulator